MNITATNGSIKNQYKYKRTINQKTIYNNRCYLKKNSVTFQGGALQAQVDFAPLLFYGTAYLVWNILNLIIERSNGKEFDKKMELSNLPKNLQYKNVKSVEKGIKFTKEVLKIPNVEGDFTLDAINTINKGIVRVSNIYGGKLFMPKSLVYTKLKDAHADVNLDIYSDKFKQIRFNTETFYGNTQYDKQTVFHEMGHLQDYKQYVEDKKKLFKRLYKKHDLQGISKLHNDRYLRMNLLNKEKNKKYKDNPELLKKTYPSFYEFINNESTQKIAGDVCNFAKEGIGELIAEIFEKMVAKEKISNNIINLYKKYNGPILPSRLKV